MQTWNKKLNSTPQFSYYLKKGREIPFFLFNTYIST
jgi:hypothetical protein